MKKLFLVLYLSLLCMNTYANQLRPTIVLVHGALLTSSIWEPVQSYLQNDGYNVVTIDMPGRTKDGIEPKDATLTTAVSKLCKVINAQNNPSLLVAHSQAGAMITQATHDCGDNIKGLVYVAAVVPLPNEKVFSLLNDQDNQNFDLATTIDENLGLAIPNLKGPIKELFIGNAHDEDANHAINNMVPEPIILGDGTLHYDLNKFNKITKFYIKTSQDKIISPETQNKYINRINFKTIYTIDSGHSPFVTHPHLLAKNLEDIINKVTL
jgi:pimeloyl-ACP methyl ester carboxylesterase